MKIIINGKFLTQKITGVQRFAREILNELDKICSDLDIEIAVPSDITDIPLYKNIKAVKVGKRHGTVWEQTCLPRYAKKKKGVTLNLCNSAPLFGKKIVTIHDVKIKAHPEFFSKKFLLWYRILFKNITKKALQIITVSEFSKKEIIKYYKVNPEKVTVVYNAWQHFERIGFDENTLEKYRLEKDNYFFSMSSLEPNKNLNWIIETAKRNQDEVFAIAGLTNNKVFSDNKIVLPCNVKLLGYVSDEEAKTLMRDCEAFIYPTIYEGFGIPPLEALSAGAKNVIVSDTEVMHEVFGRAVQYIDSTKTSSLSDEIMNAHNSNKSLLFDFSWEKSANKLLKILF